MPDVVIRFDADGERYEIPLTEGVGWGPHDFIDLDNGKFASIIGKFTQVQPGVFQVQVVLCKPHKARRVTPDRPVQQTPPQILKQLTHSLTQVSEKSVEVVLTLQLTDISGLTRLAILNAQLGNTTAKLGTERVNSFVVPPGGLSESYLTSQIGGLAGKIGTSFCDAVVKALTDKTPAVLLALPDGQLETPAADE
jgi:hypothetical protein